jgi:redox-sensitive bicupin YhaK (pirin superfamily)
MAVFANDEGEIGTRSWNESDVLLLAGEPINEPVASWGPFVMNTPQKSCRRVRTMPAG